MWYLMQAAGAGTLMGTMWCVEDIARAFAPPIYREVSVRVAHNIGWFFWLCAATGFMMNVEQRYPNSIAWRGEGVRQTPSRGTAAQ